MYRYLFLFSFSILCAQHADKRIVAQWPESSRSYSLSSSYLTTEPFTLHKDYFFNHLLPQDDIPLRNQQTVISGTYLSSEIENSWKELNVTCKKPKSNTFKVLKDCHWSYQNKTGFIVLVLNNVPFVIKLYQENPQSFINIHKKDTKQIGMFLMNGTHRYITGFTRISTLHHFRNLIHETPELQNIDMPRKWFWQPENNSWFKITGYGLSQEPALKSTMLPSTYAVISDYIHKGPAVNKKQALQIAQSFSPHLDANPENFRIEPNTNKVIITDTEDLAHMIGIKEELDPSIYNSYAHWWKYLLTKGYTNVIKRHLPAKQSQQSGDSQSLFNNA